MIKLKRLHITRYRNVAPCTLIFSDQLNVVIGPNGSGKTTLLDLIATILRTDLGDTRDPFSIDVDLTFSSAMLSGHIESLVELPARDREPRPEPGGAPSKAAEEAQPPLFELTLTHPERPGYCTITRTDDRAPRAFPRDAESTDIDSFFPTTAPWSLLYEVFTRANHATFAVAARNTLRNVARFDEPLGASGLTPSGHAGTGLAHTWQGARFNVWTITGSRRTHRIAFATEGTVPPGITDLITRHLGEGIPFVVFDGGELRFLSRACRIFGMRTATVRLDVIGQIDSPPDFEVSELGNLQLAFTRHDGAVIRDVHLSLGQKRLLAFLYALDANPDFMLADELATSLHPSWVRECMAVFGQRQVFLASQSPVVLDELEFTSAEQVKARFIVCRTEVVGDGEKMVWRNLTDEEAAMVYRAHEAGTESVSAILQSQGLW